MNTKTDTQLYYAHNPVGRDLVYLKPERQDDLRTLRSLFCAKMAGEEVLEIACGTGYWTKVIADVACSVSACDFNEEMVEVSLAKLRGAAHVTVLRADAYFLDRVHGRFSAGFAGLWWSQVPREKLDDFVCKFHRKLLPGSLVAFVDNTFIEGYSRPIVEWDDAGNTYQLRGLPNGREYKVLKNYPSELEVRQCIEGLGEDVEYIRLKYYWGLVYRIRST